ncbi:ABC transporter permease [Desulfuromonas acetoxidans]|uniref:ABC transporter permease n=1 Tax=Desulfuromonas acetoxidans TaxID=891 RepID=UPI00292E31D5|nr:ABC transporter permease [Desulfuromonas acetoxidans]
MINLQRLKAVVVKEFIHILRDWRSLALAVAIPVLLLALFAYALNMDLKQVPTAVIDRSMSPQSRDLISQFDGSSYFSIEHSLQTLDEVQSAMRQRRILVALLIERDFARHIEQGKTAQVQLIVDGSDANIGRLALGYAQALGWLYSQQVLVERSRHLGSEIQVGQVEGHMRAWYNQGLVSTYNIVPGIIAIVMVVIASMLASVTVAREWETGTMEQLISTPIRRLELTLGKAIPLYFIGIVDVLIAAGLGQWLFDVPLRGEPALVLLVASVFLVGVLFYGLVLSIVLKKQVVANQIALITGFLPTLVLSGFVFTIANMPLPIRILSHIFPARYFIAMLRSIYLKGVGLEMMVSNFVLLTLYAAVMVVIANRALKLRLN